MQKAKLAITCGMPSKIAGAPAEKIKFYARVDEIGIDVHSLDKTMMVKLPLEVSEITESSKRPGDYTVFVCDCGFTFCEAVQVKVDLQDEQVIWREALKADKDGHFNDKLDMPPYVFHKDEYSDQIEKMSRMVELFQQHYGSDVVFRKKDFKR